jgi:hypothetical protein
MWNHPKNWGFGAVQFVEKVKPVARSSRFRSNADTEPNWQFETIANTNLCSIMLQLVAALNF